MKKFNKLYYFVKLSFLGELIGFISNQRLCLRNEKLFNIKEDKKINFRIMPQFENQIFIYSTEIWCSFDHKILIPFNY